MKAASAKQIKDELRKASPLFLNETLLRLARFKKENKELLTYLLFYKTEESEYITDVKVELDDLFEGLNLSNVYFTKKGLRKIIRNAIKYSRYTDQEVSILEIHLHLATLLCSLKLSFKKNKQVSNMFQSIMKKINLITASLHPDLQFDYKSQINELQNNY